MGRGNVSVNGPYEGLFYIDRDDVDIYTLEKDGETQVRLLRDMEQDDFKYWSFSPDLSRIAMDDILENLKFEFMARFSSFGEVDDWISRDRQAILESKSRTPWSSVLVTIPGRSVTTSLWRTEINSLSLTRRGRSSIRKMFLLS